MSEENPDTKVRLDDLAERLKGTGHEGRFEMARKIIARMGGSEEELKEEYRKLIETMEGKLKEPEKKAA